MNELAVLDKSGDTKTIWDPRNTAEVEAAKATFDRLKRERYLIYRVDPETGNKGTVMHSFDAAAEKMIAVPPVVGG